MQVQLISSEVPVIPLQCSFHLRSGDLPFRYGVIFISLRFAYWERLASALEFDVGSLPGSNQTQRCGRNFDCEIERLNLNGRIFFQI